MIIVKNNILPFQGFGAMTVWPFVFVRKSAYTTWRLTDKWKQVLNHESIHARQQIEMLWLPFFVWYGVEYLLRLVFGRRDAYHNVSFEREAYRNEADAEYLNKRKPWSWLKYISK